MCKHKAWSSNPQQDVCPPTISHILSPTLLFNLAKMSRPTETEGCMESLIADFQKYNGKAGNSCQLSKTEFLAFMNTERAAFMKNQRYPDVLDHMRKKLDLNRDRQLDFQEFLNTIGSLAIACLESFFQTSKKCI
ncbi:protein S100-A11-like [Acomys russatus]|uniref:protein S100-A11-like n=1 Tax=Acomys russatus TaxID=60746 RepID=UPI0021E26D9B|nr:protein S100-A11-like [Acomys russatus]